LSTKHSTNLQGNKNRQKAFCEAVPKTAAALGTKLISRSPAVDDCI